MTRALLSGMKIMPPPPVLAAICVVPDEVQFDCPQCDLVHILTRGLDYDEDAEGVWRIREADGYECDCGALIQADFTVSIQPPKRP